MQLKITGHHIEVSPTLRERVAGKMEKIERHVDNVTDIHVILTVEKQRHKAEATVSASGTRLYADAIEDDMYAAIDSMSEKLQRRLKKYKEKLNDHHARDARKPRFG